MGASHPWALWAVGVTAGFVFLVGMVWNNDGMLSGGAAVLCLVAYTIGNWVGRLTVWDSHSSKGRGPVLRPEPAAPVAASPERSVPAHLTMSSGSSGPPRTSAGLVEDLLGTGRYALLLRPETKEHLSQAQIIRAIRQLDEAMSLVPAGRVLLGQLAEQVAATCGATDADPKLLDRNMTRVEPVYLDRYTVSNQQFQQFVDAGGYERLEYWHEEALPALLDFVDQTGQPGPRFWSDGNFPPGEQYLPVTGVSWYEAWAYARWVGKRLPTDAEWTKAGAWPIESSPGRIAQRRYPWGESFDLRRANLWASGRRQPGDVDEFPTGVSVGGVYQLVGNVWEWTDSALVDSIDPLYHVPETFKSIRGGAFDTYFESQATCHFESGEHPLTRRPNIGFRLALPMADLDAALADDSAAGGNASPPPEPAPPDDVAPTEEVAEETTLLACGQGSDEP